MKKSLLFSILFLCGISLSATQINSVIANVNNEPITTYELRQMMAKTGGNYQKAMEALISEKLQNAEMKRLQILISPYEVEKQLNLIAQNNKISLPELQKRVEKSGKSFATFKKEVETDMKLNRFYQAVLSNIKITPEAVRAFYDANPQFFTKFNGVKAVRYVAKNPQILENIARGARVAQGPNLFVQNINIAPKQMSQEAFAFFAQIPQGAYSRITQNHQGFYEMFYVSEKMGLVRIPYEEAQEHAFEIYSSKEREKAAQTYFDKLRSSAIIEMKDRTNGAKF
jgi:putative periplasmic protein